VGAPLPRHVDHAHGEHCLPSREAHGGGTLGVDRMGLARRPAGPGVLTGEFTCLRAVLILFEGGTA
jgi:hypothetical protein